MATVTFDGVWKRFGEVVAVNDLNLEINDGEFMVLVGPSGCGKTTSLRMIAGLEEITQGSLSIGDKVVNHVAPKDRDIAMVFQSYALYPHMTVYDNMAFGLKLRKTPKAEIDRRVREAAGMLSCENLLQRKPRELSGGQRQRVALGRAIVREPAVFLMDEPLSNLDAKLRVQTRAEIARLHQRLGTTTVYVTHDQVEAMTMGERIAVMSEARLQQVGTPQELYDHPDNRFVAGFIGSPAMNFLDVSAVRSGEAVTLKGDGVEIPLPARYKGSFAEHKGDRLIVGLRPEHLDVRADGPAGTLTGKADVVEYLGNEELIHVRVGSSDVVALIDSSNRVRPGDDLALRIPLDKVHLFDPESTLALDKERDPSVERAPEAAVRALDEAATPQVTSV
jgi:multiple sugar transport system ATP-binding protein